VFVASPGAICVIRLLGPATLPSRHVPDVSPPAKACPRWIHEIKYDGYRMMAVRASDSTRLVRRRLMPGPGRWTKQSGLVEAWEAFKAWRPS
jgi:ATP-dependent DNA ligase